MDSDCICKNKNAFEMVLNHLGQNFNDNEEQKMQFESMLRNGLDESWSKQEIKKNLTEGKDDHNSLKYIPQSKFKINVFEKPSIPDKLLYKNNDSSYIYTLCNYSSRDHSRNKNKMQESPLKPFDFNAGIK